MALPSWLRERPRAYLPLVLAVWLPAVVAVDRLAATGCSDFSNPLGAPATTYGGCYVQAPALVVLALAGVTVVATLVGVAAAWLLGDLVERATARPLGRLLFDPPDAVVRAVLALAVLAAALARPLLAGHVTANPALWAVLAVPYYPFVASLLAGGAVAVLVPAQDAGPLAFALLAVLALLVVAGVVATVAWLYVLAAGLARLPVAGRAVREWAVGRTS